MSLLPLLSRDDALCEAMVVLRALLSETAVGHVPYTLFCARVIARVGCSDWMRHRAWIFKAFMLYARAQTPVVEAGEWGQYFSYIGEGWGEVWGGWR